MFEDCVQLGVAGATQTYSLDIDIRDLPLLWWDLLRSCVNDYLLCREESQEYQESVSWLFLEDCHEVEESDDVLCFSKVAEHYLIDVSKLRFQLQCLRDNGVAGATDFMVDRDPRGRKKGFLTETTLERIIEECRI